jgi:tRNA-dihydrouridine synthase B
LAALPIEYLARQDGLLERIRAAERAFPTGHLIKLYDFYGEYTDVHIARKHMAWSSKDQPDRFRHHINQAESPDEQPGHVSDYFATLAEQQAMAA